MSATAEIAEKLVAHCRAGTEAQALDALYSEDAVSVEAPEAPTASEPAYGLDAIRKKHSWWSENFEVHSSEIEGPFVHGPMFALTFEIDATDKSSGQRWKSKEVALYHVENGRIVREEFFMAPAGG